MRTGGRAEVALTVLPGRHADDLGEGPGGQRPTALRIREGRAAGRSPWLRDTGVLAKAARPRRRRWITPTVILVGGVALSLAATFGGGHFTPSALIAGLAFTVVATRPFVFIGTTRGDIGAMVASAPDERQRGIDLRATAASGLVMALVLIVGPIVSLAKGRSGQPWVDLAGAVSCT